MARAQTRRRLAGEPPASPEAPVRRIAGTTAKSTEAPQIPLGATANAQSQATHGLKVSAARKRSLYDNRAAVVGMRVMFAIDFYDVVTKQPVSPTNVKVTASIGDTSVDVSLVENSGRVGYYTGSFVPTVPGEWTAIARAGALPGEVVDDTQFYVLDQ